MKKRCTNSACRRWFQVDSVCPYCGKAYPRLPAARCAVELEGYDEKKKIAVMRTLRMVSKNLSLVEAREIVRTCPCIICRDVDRKEAHRWCAALDRVGAHTKIISANISGFEK